MTETRTIGAVTCLGCGCACDDIAITVRDGAISDAARACALGRRWFGDGTVPWAVLRDGQPVALEAAMAEAAEVLAAAQGGVLVYLGPDWPCEAQRAALAVADVLQATVDTATSASAAAGIVAAQRRGRAGATLGEIRNRADVLVCWGVDPAERYPRYFSRYAAEPAGTHVPAGRAGRTIVAVTVGRDRGPADADVMLTLDPADEIAALSVMRATLLGSTLAPESTVLQEAAELARRLARARYAVLVHDAELPNVEPPDTGSPDTGPPDAAPSNAGPTGAHRDPLRAEALLALALALNGPTRGALSTLRAGGNRSGVEAVLTWQTGYPFGVDFAGGMPRYAPRARGLDRLAAGEYHAALVAGSVAALPAEYRAALGERPVIAIGPRASTAPFAVRVAIDTGMAGIHDPGIAYRMDDVPLPLRPPLAGPRTAVAVMNALMQAVLARMRGNP